jgi:CubicO group peptidase (beta-lactamase class C family)
MSPLLPSTARSLLARTARAQRESRVPSLLTGVVRDGGLAWSAARGAVTEPHADVQYRLGSITKPVTAVAVMRLRDEGLLTLDDPLERHVAGTPFGDRTVGQLLAHGAGLRSESPGQWWERVEGGPWDSLELSPDDVKHPAGRRFHYSNLGYGALGELVARARGRPWEQVVRDEVLLPLGMDRTTPRPSGRAARGWAVHPWADVLLPEPEEDGGAMAAAGQLWATLTDLARFASFLLGDTADVLSPDTLEEMTQPSGVDASAKGWSAYGLGLGVARLGDATVVGHGGSMPGFVASVFVDRANGFGTVLLCNATSGLDGTLVGDLHQVVRSAEPAIGPTWSPGTVAPEAMSLSGTWYWGTYAYGIRARADGLLDLVGLLGAGRASRFRSCGDGTWVGLDGYHAGEVLAPVRDAAGEVVALDLGSFVFSRTPYDPAAPHPGGVHPDGWGAGRD